MNRNEEKQEKVQNIVNENITAMEKDARKILKGTKLNYQQKLKVLERKQKYNSLLFR